MTIPYLRLTLGLCAALGAACGEWSHCECSSAEESGADKAFEQGAYSFSHADTTNAVREGMIDIAAKEVRMQYRGPDGRMYRATFAKRARRVDKN